MKPIDQMTLPEAINALYNTEHLQTVTSIANRIDTLLFEQAQRHDAWVDALENRINSLEAQHRWIPVSERLPTEEDATTLGGNMGIEFWSNKFGGMKYFCTIERFGIDFIQSNEITHWKRITPPEGV
jgi:hypothetical protein